MVVEDYGICPKCEKELEQEYNYCPWCQEELIWLERDAYNEEYDFPKNADTERSEKFIKGNIKCECGKDFYYETKRKFVKCLYCGKKHDVSK